MMRHIDPIVETKPAARETLVNVSTKVLLSRRLFSITSTGDSVSRMVLIAALLLVLLLNKCNTVMVTLAKAFSETGVSELAFILLLIQTKLLVTVRDLSKLQQ